LDERPRVGLGESGQVEYVGCGSIGRGRVSTHGLRNRTEYYFLSLYAAVGVETQAKFGLFGKHEQIESESELLHRLGEGLLVVDGIVVGEKS
jgi:hypothetical protein